MVANSGGCREFAVTVDATNRFVHRYLYETKMHAESYRAFIQHDPAADAGAHFAPVNDSEAVLDSAWRADVASTEANQSWMETASGHSVKETEAISAGFSGRIPC